jgi:hypothetical protein
VKRVLEHYEAHSEEEAAAEHEASFEATMHTAMEVPVFQLISYRPFGSSSRSTGAAPNPPMQRPGFARR